MIVDELLSFIGGNGIPGTRIFVELCALPDKVPFYEKIGFDSDEGLRLKMMYKVKRLQLCKSKQEWQNVNGCIEANKKVAGQ